jgi:predicted metal-dependent hydrolase
MITRVKEPPHATDLGGRLVEYRIRRSRTATRCRIRVGPDGVEVVLPQTAVEGRAATFLQENRDWVLGQLAFVERMGGVRAAKKGSGRTVLLRGREMAVEVVTDDSARQYGLVEVTEEQVRVRVPAGSAVDPWRTLEAWFRRQAREDIVRRVDERRRQMPRTSFGRLYVMGWCPIAVVGGSAGPVGCCGRVTGISAWEGVRWTTTT